MPNVTLSGGGISATAFFATNEAYPFAETLAKSLSDGLRNGAYTPLNYAGGAVAPGAAGGVVVFATAPGTTVEIPASDVGVFITGGPTAITGGAQGETVIAGSSGLTYTDITPSGNAIDYIVAGDGANVIGTATTGTGNYQIDTGAGNDRIFVNGNGLIKAGTGQNAISVVGGNSVIYAGGYDTITADGSGTDTVYIGTDTVDSGGGRTVINPGSVNFTIFAGSISTIPLLLNPGSGSDIVSLGAGGGTVHGGSAGNNALVAGAGAPATLYGGGNGDQLFATGNAPVLLVAGAGNETLSAAGMMSNGGSISASTADNVFRAGSGNDTMIGGHGNDTYYINNGGDIVTEAADDGTDTVHATIGYTLTANVENLVLDGTASINGVGNALDNVLTGNGGNNVLQGLAGNDTITAGAGADTVDGAGGNDILFGNGGADTLHGGAGNDTIDGGAGNDIMDGGADTDTASYASAPSAVTVSLALQGQAQNTIGAGVDTLTNFENLTGSAYNDTLSGDGNANLIHGGSGDDVIMAGAGADTVYGDPGNDTLYGNGGADILYGNGGADRLIGGAGADTLTGGAGNDTFVYLLATDSTPSAPDLITDFVSGQDKIDLTALHLASVSNVKISSGGGLTYVDIDANNDGKIDMRIALVGANLLTQSDIIGLPGAAATAPVAAAHAGAAAIGHHGFHASLHVAAFDHGLYG